MKIRKLLAGVLSVTMLASATAAFAAAPSAYDGQSYESLGYTSDDPDGQINLAVISAEDVKLGNTMYIKGSVYANGNIYVVDGAGNTIDGLFISKTGNTTYGPANEGDFTTFEAVGYKIVDSNGNEETSTAYDSKPNYGGAIYDADTSFECTYTDYTVPDISNYISGTTTLNIYSDNVLTIDEDTHFEDLDLSGESFIIDATNNDVNVVIDKFTWGSADDPYFTVLGDNKVNIYINSIYRYGAVTGDLKFYTQKATGVLNNISSIWWLNTADQMKEDLQSLNAADQITFYVDSDDSIDTINVQGSRAVANIVTSKNLTINDSSYIIGDYTVGGDYAMKGSALTWGTVCAPNSETFIGEAAVLYGQLHTRTLDMAGAGAIIYQADSITQTSSTPEPTETDTPVVDDVVTDEVVYVHLDGTTVTPVEYAGQNYWWQIEDDSNGVLQYLKSIILGSAEGSFQGNYVGAQATFNYSAWIGSYNEAVSLTGVEITDPELLASIVGKSFVMAARNGNDDSGIIHTVKVVFVGDTPEQDSTPAPIIPDGDEIDLNGLGYAYIFGYEPETLYFDQVDEEGNTVTVEYTPIYMAPNDDVTREQVAAMLMRMTDQTNATKNKTYEVTPNIAAWEGQWFERGLAYLASKGAFDGIDYVNVGPVTRGEVAKLIAYGLNLSDTVETPFTDIADSEYKPYIEIMYAYGYMNGTSDLAFEPNRVMTRAEFCKLFNNIIGREGMGLETADGQTVTPADYSIVDISGHWAEKTILKATSAYDDEGYVDFEIRQDNIRNKLDNYDSQLEY